MKIKRTIAVMLITVMLMTATMSSIYADTILDLSKLQQNLETIIINKAEDAKAMINIASELIKYAVAKFKDVKDSDWYAEAVGKLNVLKIIDGLPDGSFNPQGQVTRAQFVKMLVQAMEYKKIDSLSFEDLKPFASSKPHWASVYIETALRNGVIVKDEIGNNFYPDVPLTRKDMAMMMFRALKLEPSIGANPFADLTESNGYFTKLYEEYLVRGNVISGKILFKPEGLTTRAEAATIISRMVDYKADPEEYVKTVGLETRLKEGTATEEDKMLNRDMELQKQASDKNYIIEPDITADNSNYSFAYTIINLNNYTDYADDVQVRAICITDTDQNRTATQDISTGKYTEERMDNWFTIKQHKNAKNKGITYTQKWNIKKINGEYVDYDYNYKSGTVLMYEVQIKRGNTINKYLVKVVIP